MKIKSFFILLISILLISTIVFTVRVPATHAFCPGTLTRIMDYLSQAVRRGADRDTAKTIIDKVLGLATSCDDEGNVITGIPYPTDSQSPYPTPGPGTVYPTSPPGDGTWPFFCQMNPALQDSYRSLTNHGCGPVSLSMVYCKNKGYDNTNRSSCHVRDDTKTVTAEIAADLTALGSYNPNSGIYITNTVKNYIETSLGLLVVPVNSDLASWKEQIEVYHRYIWATTPSVRCGVGCGGNPNIYFGHVFAVDAVDLVGQRFHMRNSNNCVGAMGWEEYTQEPPGKMWYTLSDFPAGLSPVSYAIGI